MLTNEELSLVCAEMLQWLGNLTEALRRVNGLPADQAELIASNCEELARILEGLTGDELPVGLATKLHAEATLLRNEAPNMPR